jgi:radical SAM protein with 4Fe4S-binding SPASM domain
MDGELLVIEHPDQHYRTLFNQQTGFFVRKEDKDWPEPTWSADGPELIDLSITSFCNRGCSFCYRGANNVSYQHLGLPDIISITEQAASCGTLQMALGGGNPNQHPRFVEILRIIREHNIVPSFTTNGDGLSDDIIKATADYCGAMAISIYPPYDLNYYEGLTNRIREYGIKVNIHAILHKDSLEMWSEWLLNPPVFLKNINALIFLNYKPIGKEGLQLLPTDLNNIEKFFQTANSCKNFKIGFDSCSISGIVQWMDVPDMMLESCEAAKFSCFISEDMKMYPCSFMIEKGMCGDLRQQSLLDIWQNNKHFKRFREVEKSENCIECKHYKICQGGCRFFPEINFCK